MAVLVIMAIEGISGQAPAPGPGAVGEVDCFTTLLGMSDCLPYVTTGSNDTKPNKQCCSELAGLVENSPKCLCELLSDPDKVGFTIDVDRAMKLPTQCHVSTPSISLCSRKLSFFFHLSSSISFLYDIKYTKLS